MSYKAPDYNNLVHLFNLYLANHNTKAPSFVGFKSFMLTEQNYPAWMVKALVKQINKDPDLKFHLDTIIEASLAEGAVTGIYKGDVAKFFLKNNHNYSDSRGQAQGGVGSTTKQIVFKPAVRKNEDK